MAWIVIIRIKELTENPFYYKWPLLKMLWKFPDGKLTELIWETGDTGDILPFRRMSGEFLSPLRLTKIVLVSLFFWTLPLRCMVLMVLGMGIFAIDFYITFLFSVTDSLAVMLCILMIASTFIGGASAPIAEGIMHPAIWTFIFFIVSIPVGILLDKWKKRLWMKVIEGTGEALALSA